MVWLEGEENQLSRSDLVVLKTLHGDKLSPWQIAERSHLNVHVVQDLIVSLLERGLIIKSSDGFTSLIEITKRGEVLLNAR